MEVTIDAQEYIDEIVENIKKKDTIKADIVMSFITDMDYSVQEKMLCELSKVNNSFTVGYIIHLLEIVDRLKISEDDIKITLQDMLINQPENLIYLFENPQICEKIDIIDLATAMQYDGAIPYLIKLLNMETRPHNIISIIAALGAISNPEVIGTISEYLYSENKDLTFAALYALRDIGTPDAVDELARRLGSDDEVDKNIIDIFINIQDEHSLENLNAVLKKHDPKIRNYTKTKMVQIGQKVVPIIIKNLEDPDSEFVIHSLNILGIIGDSSAVNAIRQLLFNEPADANIRFAAYEALGMLPLDKGIFILSNGLNDSMDLVRTAAARAIERNNNAVLRAGVANLIKKGDAEAKNIVAAFINAEADSMFRNMFPEEPFQSLAISYFKTDAHPDTCKHFSTVLRQVGYEDFAQEIIPISQDLSRRFNVAVVDDSRMLLKIYKSNLYEIGYASKLFEFPESAVQQILENKPDIVLTDLNMPKITGIELTRQLRENYAKDELPIILVTTQTDKDETESAFKAGINDVIYKPFTKEQLKQKIDQLLEKF